MTLHLPPLISHAHFKIYFWVHFCYRFTVPSDIQSNYDNRDEVRSTTRPAGL